MFFWLLEPLSCEIVMCGWSRSVGEAAASNGVSIVCKGADAYDGLGKVGVLVLCVPSAEWFRARMTAV